jgi:hypothetical protein
MNEREHVNDCRRWMREKFAGSRLLLSISLCLPCTPTHTQQLARLCTCESYESRAHKWGFFFSWRSSFSCFKHTHTHGIIWERRRKNFFFRVFPALRELFDDRNCQQLYNFLCSSHSCARKKRTPSHPTHCYVGNFCARQGTNFYYCLAFRAGMKGEAAATKKRLKIHMWKFNSF